MKMPDACLDTIESAMTRSTTALARALSTLGSCAGGRGTCLLIEHDELGETLIADRNWTLGRDETLRNREHFALVDLRQDEGFRRFAVLVEPLGTEAQIDDAGCGLALSALRVVQELADIVASMETSANDMTSEMPQIRVGADALIA
jgi:hypothetical protein